MQYLVEFSLPDDEEEASKEETEAEEDEGSEARDVKGEDDEGDAPEINDNAGKIILR